MDRVIKIYKGEETGIIRENYASRCNSIFAEQYKIALEAIKTYLDSSNLEQDNSDSTKKGTSSVNDRSNIFAFIGDRGTGKTSCMQSVADMLPEIKDEYKVLGIVDPTLFDDNTNILHIVIGTLFQEFKENLRKSDSFGLESEEKDYEKRKQNAIEAFQKVKDCIKIISNPDSLKCEGDDISQLAEMASVSDLRKQIKLLVDKYLKFFDKKVLVLQIDDIDLQTKYAYRMVEEIRKYFVLKNVVILMSFKLEQLSKVIELENANNYKPLIDLKRVSDTDIQEMAAKYVLKLIPINQRIFMPTFEVYADSSLEYYIKREDSSPRYRYHSIEYAVTGLIYEKCRFLFYHSKGVISPIVPRNLRELRHLLETLISMRDYYQIIKDTPLESMDKDVLNKLFDENRKNNKSVFLSYFFGTWVNNNISSSDYAIVCSLIDNDGAATLNKVVLLKLRSRFEKNLKDNKDFDPIFNHRNATYNISIADVYSILDYVKQRINDVPDKKLIFFIETFYSIKLYEYYDELTYFVDHKDLSRKENGNSTSDNDEEYKDPLFDENDYSDESIRKIDVTDGISSYELLVGGNFINTSSYPLIPRDTVFGWSDNKYRIYYKKLKDEAKDIAAGKIIDENKIKLVEFLALCISRPWSSNSTFNKDYRASTEVYYQFNSNAENDLVEFELGSFFFNIINPERAYNRLFPDFFKKIKDNDCSLYKTLLNKANELREDWYNCPEHSLMSCAAFRNYEILIDFVNRRRYNPAKGSRGSLFANVKYFMQTVAGYQIKTYDRQKPESQDANKPYVVSFEYLKDALPKKESVDFDKLKEYFDSFFSPEDKKGEKKVFDKFDVDGILLLFKNQSYSADYFKGKLAEYCSKIFDDNKNLKKYGLALIDEKTNNGRLSRESISEVLMQLKERHES